MKEASVIEKVKEKAVNGKIACRVALALAVELGVPPKEVGDAANKAKIKIAACQLGCFN